MTLQSNRAKLNGDASAHPTIEGVQNMPKYLGGMTKRELIAMHAMAAIIAKTPFQEFPEDWSPYEKTAIGARDYADALLAELAK